jgi:vacuolar protein sorting-associated protein 13A/C
VFVLVEPLDGDYEEAIDVEAEIQKAKQEKLKLADSMAHEYLQGQEDAQASWMSRMAATIVDNIQIEIRNVHVRYEDTVTAPTPFYLGVTIESVSAHSTDSDWLEKVFLADTTTVKQIHKFFDLRSFAVYWNNNSATLDPQSLHSSGTCYDESVLKDGPLVFESAGEMAGLMQDLIYSEANECFPRHQYVLHPVSASLKLRINKEKPPVSGTRDGKALSISKPINTDPHSLPKFTFDFLFEQVNLSLGTCFEDLFIHFRSVSFLFSFYFFFFYSIFCLYSD